MLNPSQVILGALLAQVLELGRDRLWQVFVSKRGSLGIYSCYTCPDIWFLLRYTGTATLDEPVTTTIVGFLICYISMHDQFRTISYVICEE